MKQKRYDQRQPRLFPEFDEPTPEAVHEKIQETESHADRASRDQGGPPETPPLSLSAGDLVILVDSHSLIYQVFHAMPSMTGPTGQEVGAVHGFLRDLADLRDKWKPAYLICTFDESETTFRNSIYEQYKAHREPMPEALRAQMSLIREAMDTLQIVSLSLAGFEADDILATLARHVESAGARCLLVTSDKDCRQLLSDHVSMLNIRKAEIFDEAALRATWGIAPSQVVDFQSLVGDSVDNVPGVPQIGPKAAQQLLAEFGSLENIYANLDKVAGAKRQETLRLHRHQAELSQSLVRLRADVPIAVDWPAWRTRNPNPGSVEAFFRELGFRKLAERFVTPNTPHAGQPTPPKIDRSRYRCAVPVAWVSQGTADGQASHGPVYQTFDALRDEVLGYLRKQPPDQRWLAIDSETTSLAARDAKPVGYSIAWGDGQAAYLPLLGPESERLLEATQVRQFLQELLGDPSVRKIGQNLKYDLIILRGDGISVKGVAMDTMVADYLLEPGGRNHNLDDIAKRFLDHQTITIDQLIGSGKEQRSMASVATDLIATYAAEDVDIPFRIRPILEQQLQAAKLDRVFNEIEIPLIEVLAEMEFNGIAIDVARLHALSQQFATKIDRLKEEVLDMAGEPFNPDSPKQLAAILFDKLGLRVVKRTKTGPSTDAEVLQELALEHPLPEKIMDYRQAAKLKSTYLDALPQLISPTTGRVHTSFRQDVAATGRLSSSEPNLQNIPIRTEEGRAIRSAFVPGVPGWVLLTADYSQIELRVLAHYCGDPSLMAAFASDEDVHARVAAEVHGIDVEHVTSSMRRRAKAINFGILYGQSPFGLAKALKISKGEAGEFIDRYFERYSSVRAFIRETLESCRRDGYVMTISGRKRFLKGIRDFGSLNPQQQKTLLEPERMAVNTVIQGSAADLIKLAMVHIYRRLAQSPLQAKLLLQIHDELVFEVHPDDRDALVDLVRHEMIHAVQLKVPLKVDVKTGADWSACDTIS